MQLLPKELEARFAEVGSQELVSDPIVIAKFFNPTGSGTWYATEYLPGEKIFFGYVSLFGNECDEWGYFSLQELEEVRCAFGLGIERDLYCGEFPMSKILGAKKEIACGCFE